MLAVATGLQKSASSALFDLMIAVLQQAGHDQSVWCRETLPALAARDGVAVSKTGFMPTDFNTALMPALKASGFDYWHAVKTNGGLVQKCRSLMDVGLMQAIASYRDPGDAAWSMLAHVEQQMRDGGPDRSRLAHILTPRDAIDYIAVRTAAAATWLRDPRVLKLEYALIKDNPAEACKQIAAHLNVDLPDADAAARHAGVEPGSASHNRFAREADASDRAYAESVFSDYAGLVRQTAAPARRSQTG
jgi:hypothetical protein